MTELDDAIGDFAPPERASVSQPRKCLHPRRDRTQGVVIPESPPTLPASLSGARMVEYCARCGHQFDPVVQRKGRNNRRRGGKAELTTSRLVGGRKVGPLGQPWDIEMPGYARLQVRKYLRPESLRKIAAELARIGSGAEMPGYVWLEPGRGGERLIVFRLADFAERHGVVVEERA